jgi:hypothetical protein
MGRIGPRDVREVPVVRLYGLTKQGNSVAVHVHGVLAYFFIPAPGDDFTDQHCRELLSVLNVRGVMLHISPSCYTLRLVRLDI